MATLHAPLSLVADIGGTNTRLALADDEGIKTDTIKRYENAQYSQIETILKDFIECQKSAQYPDLLIKSVCVAMAGPVHNQRGTMTNLNWTLDQSMLRRAAQCEQAAILNDLQAQAYAIAYLSDDVIKPVFTRTHQSLSGGGGCTHLVVGVGTGFNAAVSVPTTNEAPRYDTAGNKAPDGINHDQPKGRAGGVVVPASEAGHINLPIRTEEDLNLCRHLQTLYGFAAVEDVLSGRGLETVYTWFSAQTGPADKKTAAQIIDLCKTKSNVNAEKAVHLLCRTLGTVVGNLALIHLPFGGIYLIGGVARACQPHLQASGFSHAFHDKGRFCDFMNSFSTSIICDDYAALIGGAAYLKDLSPPRI